MNVPRFAASREAWRTPVAGRRLAPAPRSPGRPACVGRRRRGARRSAWPRPGPRRLAAVARRSFDRGALLGGDLVLGHAAAPLDQRFGVGFGLGDDLLGLVPWPARSSPRLPCRRPRPWPDILPSAPRLPCAAPRLRRAGRGSARSCSSSALPIAAGTFFQMKMREHDEHRQRDPAGRGQPERGRLGMFAGRVPATSVCRGACGPAQPCSLHLHRLRRLVLADLEAGDLGDHVLGQLRPRPPRSRPARGLAAARISRLGLVDLGRSSGFGLAGLLLGRLGALGLGGLRSASSPRARLASIPRDRLPRSPRPRRRAASAAARSSAIFLSRSVDRRLDLRDHASADAEIDEAEDDREPEELREATTSESWLSLRHRSSPAGPKPRRCGLRRRRG